MNFNKIMIFFCIGLPLCIAARIMQIVFAIEYGNGFYIDEYKTFGIAMMLVILAVCVLLSVFAFKAYKTPENPPKPNLLMSIAAAVVAAALVNQLANEKLPQTIVPWQVLVIKLATLICLAYFLGAFFSGISGVKIPPILHIIPCVYFVAKTAIAFISVSSLALISDNILLIAGYSSLLLFFVNYGKLYNNLDTELNFRKILSTGLVSSVICNTQAIAYFAVNLFGDEMYLHTDISVIFTLLSFGVFTTVFIVSHFRKTA